MSQNNESFLLALTDDNKKILLQSEKEPEPFGKEVSGEELLTKGAHKRDWLIENLAQRSGLLGSLAGGSDLGKSTILRQLIKSIVAGEADFLGFRLYPKHYSCLMVCTEDDPDSVAYLFKKQVGNKTPGIFKKLRFLFDYEILHEELDEKLIANPVDMVVLDCFADVFGGDLKDTPKMRTFLRPYQRLAFKHSCFILFVHHTGKRTEYLEPSKNNLL